MIAQYSGPDRKLEYLFQHAKEVSLSPILTTGTPLATLTIDDQTYTLYCTTGGGGGSTISYNSLITSGTALGELTIDGITYTIYSKDSSKVAYTPTQTSGTQIGTLTIDGTPHILYAPNSGGGGGSLYSETVLFTGGTSSDTTFALSDTITHYNTINVYYRHNHGIDDYIEVKSYPASFLHSLVGTSVNVLGFCNDIWYYYFRVTDDTHFAYSKSNAGYICDIIGVTS